MKTTLILSAAAATFLWCMPVDAQTVVRETKTTTTQPMEVAGTIAELSPETVVVHTERDTAPVRFSFSKMTRFVDDQGNAATRDSIKSGAPVTLRYVQEGDRMIVDRVIVHTGPQAVTTETTTTTTTEDRRRHHKD